MLVVAVMPIVRPMVKALPAATAMSAQKTNLVTMASPMLAVVAMLIALMLGQVPLVVIRKFVLS